MALQLLLLQGTAGTKLIKPSSYSWRWSHLSSRILHVIPRALGSDLHFACESLERSSATKQSIPQEYLCGTEQSPGPGWQQWQNKEAPLPYKSHTVWKADCQPRKRPKFMTENGKSDWDSPAYNITGSTRGLEGQRKNKTSIFWSLVGGLTQGPGANQ